MYGDFSKDQDSLWHIAAHGKWDAHPREYHKTFNIIGKTAEEAIEKLKGKHPEVKLLSVSHKGVIDA